MGNSSSRMRVIFILRVDNESGWERSVVSVLNKCYGVESFRMAEGGFVEICGRVDPSAVLRMLWSSGRFAEVCWLKFGVFQQSRKADPCLTTQLPSCDQDEDVIHIACCSVM